MTTSQKKFFFLVVMIAVAFGANIVPRDGKVITAGDNLKKGGEQLTLASLESQAAVVPQPGGSGGEVKIGPEGSPDNVSQSETAFKSGAFTAPLTSEPAFAKKADAVPPEIGATIAFVGDLESGTAYLEKGANRHWPIASITKLMTATVASKALSPDAIVTIQSEDFPVDQSATSQYLKPGETYRASDIIQVMLIASDNVAAEVLARSYGRDAFLSKMNEQARLWGMSHTYYNDPSGLSPVNQSSVEDLEKLAFQLVKNNPDILAITRKPGVRITEQSSKKERRILPINIFAGRSDFIGGKTGFIDEAGGNLLSIFSVKKRPILIVVFNSPGRFEDTTTLLSWFKENYE